MRSHMQFVANYFVVEVLATAAPFSIPKQGVGVLGPYKHKNRSYKLVRTDSPLGQVNKRTCEYIHPFMSITHQHVQRTRVREGQHL